MRFAEIITTFPIIVIVFTITCFLILSTYAPWTDVSAQQSTPTLNISPSSTNTATLNVTTSTPVSTSTPILLPTTNTPTPNATSTPVPTSIPILLPTITPSPRVTSYQFSDEVFGPILVLVGVIITAVVSSIVSVITAKMTYKQEQDKLKSQHIYDVAILKHQFKQKLDETRQNINKEIWSKLQEAVGGIFDLQGDPVTFEISLADSDLEKAGQYLEKELGWPQPNIDFVLNKANEDDRREAYRYTQAIRKIGLIKNKQVVEFHNYFVKNEFYFQEELSDKLDEIDKKLSYLINLYEIGYVFQDNEKVEYAHGQFKETVLPLLQEIKQLLRKTIEIEMPT